MLNAICIWGDKDVRSSDTIELVSRIYANGGIVHMVFSISNVDAYKSLWLTNNAKRNHEMMLKTLFTSVTYVNVNSVFSVDKIHILQPDRHTVYPDRANFSVFCCDSMAGDLASLYCFNRDKKLSLSADFKKHLLNYRLNVRKITV